MSTLKSGSGGEKLKTGITGLDEILMGGLNKVGIYLITGNPGSGKTTMGLQFLLEGARLGERCLYITLSESIDELRDAASSHNWSLAGIHIYELFPARESHKEDEIYTFFHTSEIELTQATNRLEGLIQELEPQRVVLDSLTELRLITKSALLMRRQISQLKSIICKRAITCLVLNDFRPGQRDVGLQTVAHGVIHLEHSPSQSGCQRRRLSVVKMRGSDFVGGIHDSIIAKGGIIVYPRNYVISKPQSIASEELVSSGNEQLDHMLSDGIASGSATLIMGQAGVGKSSIATQFVFNFVNREKKAAIFLFDERPKSYLRRAAGLGLDLQDFINRKLLTVNEIDTATLSPGEFIHNIRGAVDCQGAEMLVIDSLDGYLNALPTERYLLIQLHKLLGYLANFGITTFLTSTQHGLVVSSLSRVSNLTVSFLADNIILLQYFEAAGRIRKAISVIKKRTGDFDNALHEMALMSGQGFKIGNPLSKFQGVLSGIPNYLGAPEELINFESTNGQ